MGIEKFQSFGRKSKIIAHSENKNVLKYTRVSSKAQKDNDSLEVQDEGTKSYADKRNFIITEEFGNTNESASNDFTRKEFMALIQRVRSARLKPYAILIYKMSRFSRTGGGGVALANELVENSGVHLIETSTGISTETESGKMEIYKRLLAAREENTARLSVTIPGMKKFVSKGFRLGNAPRGYTHFGPRVKDFKRLKPIQELNVNEEGEKLRLAWYWKLEGMSDPIIRSKLQEMGLKIPKASLNAMWSNPFYCGIQNNRLLDGEVLYGKWEKLVTEEVFLGVQDILNGNNRIGRSIEKSNENRPLVGHLFCNQCGTKMTGYIVKKKNVHYYKCQKCVGQTINCNSTIRSVGKGANDLFVDTLKQYEIDPLYNEPFKEQLRVTYSAINDDRDNERELLTKRKIKLEEDLIILERKYVFEGYDKNFYDKFKAEIETELNTINKKMDSLRNYISNLNSFIDSSVNVSQNLSKYWKSEDITMKRRLLGLVFPEGLSIDIKNRQYLTKRENSVLSIIRELKAVSDKGKMKTTQKNPESSNLVAGAGFEPTTSGL